jgi:hypothetical protein
MVAQFREYDSSPQNEVIPKPRVFTSGARDLASSATALKLDHD